MRKYNYIYKCNVTLFFREMRSLFLAFYLISQLTKPHFYFTRLPYSMEAVEIKTLTILDAIVETWLKKHIMEGGILCFHQWIKL